MSMEEIARCGVPGKMPKNHGAVTPFVTQIGLREVKPIAVRLGEAFACIECGVATLEINGVKPDKCACCNGSGFATLRVPVYRRDRT